MFFFFSKALVFLIKPITWLLALLGYAILTRRSPRRRLALLATLALLLLFTNRPLFNLATSAWEPNTLRATDIEAPYDIGILLGGYSKLPPGGYTDQYLLTEQGNRFLNVYELYRRGKIRRILLTGGGGATLPERPNECREAARFLQTLGVPADDILIEDQSRNTRENALYTTRLIRESHPEARCLLVTSAWHLRRARRCFTKTGLTVTPFAADPLGEPVRWEVNWWLTPRSELLSRWELIIKEWVGMGAYWVAGYI